jgi:hypothetical protein
MSPKTIRMHHLLSGHGGAAALDANGRMGAVKVFLNGSCM